MNLPAGMVADMEMRMYKNLKIPSSADSFLLLLLCFFVAYIAGVLISPPDAVHGINHDYHAVFKKLVAEPGRQQAQAAFSMVAAPAWSASSQADCNGLRTGPASVRVIPLRARIETWHLLLWPG